MVFINIKAVLLKRFYLKSFPFILAYKKVNRINQYLDSIVSLGKGPPNQNSKSKLFPKGEGGGGVNPKVYI